MRNFKKIIFSIFLFLSALLVFAMTDANAGIGGDCPNPRDCGDKTAHGYHCSSFTCWGSSGDYCVVCLGDDDK